MNQSLVHVASNGCAYSTTVYILQPRSPQKTNKNNIKQTNETKFKQNKTKEMELMMLQWEASSETQGLIVGTIRYFRAAIFSARKFTSRAEEPLGTFFFTKRVPEVVEIHPADWPEKYFSGQSTKRSSRVMLSPSRVMLSPSAFIHRSI